MNPALLVQAMLGLLGLVQQVAPSGKAAEPQTQQPQAQSGGVDLAAIAALVSAMRAPEAPLVEPQKPPLVLSILALVLPAVTVAAMFGLVYAVASPDRAGELIVALSISMGVLLTLTASVVQWFAGSSIGSWTKNFRAPPVGAAIAPPSVAPTPTPEQGPEPEPESEQPEKPIQNVKTLSGKCSWFGGPDDKGEPDEGLALYTVAQSKARPDLFLSGGWGKMRGLNPDALYCACRWDYKETPAAWLRSTKIKVSANGKTVDVNPVDWGPNAKTGRIIDLSPGVMKALGIQTDDVVTVDVPLPGTAPAPQQTRASGADIVALAKTRIGEKYVNVQVPKNDPNWRGPWDCAEFASWLVYQTAGILYGCTDDTTDPAKADAYTGAWKTDAATKGRMVPVSEAAGTPGAFLLRYPPAPGEMGHIAVSDGQGGTVEAAGSSTGVVVGKVSGRRWDTGVLVPGIDYSGGSVHVSGPAKIYAVGQPNMDGSKVKEIQTALAASGYSPGDVDGEYGTTTALAAAAFQKAQGIISDGEVGPDTAKALGVVL
jgi:hypothetical protein